jgi:hypothetical protein
MLHVFVETNWVVAYAAPAHRRTPAARVLLARAGRGELRLHLPAFCLVEARKVILTRFQPREADAIRQFVKWAAAKGKSTSVEREAVLKTLSMFENHVRNELARLDKSLDGLRRKRGVEIFALDDDQLRLSVDLGFSCDLQPFDLSVLAAILGRADAIRAAEPKATFAFCELDGDLQPWDKQGRAKGQLTALYDPRGIWVYRDFDMVDPPPRPLNGPPKKERTR